MLKSTRESALMCQRYPYNSKSSEKVRHVAHGTRRLSCCRFVNNRSTSSPPQGSLPGIFVITTPRNDDGLRSQRKYGSRRIPAMGEVSCWWRRAAMRPGASLASGCAPTLAAAMPPPPPRTLHYLMTYYYCYISIVLFPPHMMDIRHDLLKGLAW